MKKNLHLSGKQNDMPVKKVLKKKRVPKELVRSNNVVVKHPTSKSFWKSFERKVTEFFGTKRVPLSGSNSRHGTNSDSLHPKVYIECKVREKFSIWSLFVDTEKKAKVEKKVPVVALKQKGEQGYLLLLRPEDLEKLTKYHKDAKVE